MFSPRDLESLEEGLQPRRLHARRTGLERKKRVWTRGAVMKEKHNNVSTYSLFEDDLEQNLLIVALHFRDSGHFYLFPHSIDISLSDMTEKEAMFHCQFAVFWNNYNSFELKAKSCYFCDNMLRKYTCENNQKQHTKNNMFRETLLRCSHEMRNIKGAHGIRARHVSVYLPALIKTESIELFDPWCQRAENIKSKFIFLFILLII